MDYSKELGLLKQTEICKNCKNVVIGKGNIKSKILFVGEAPGRNEDEQGIPFVGAAGKNLDNLLEKVGLNIKEIYITNILKCRPPENRDPLPEEIESHTPYLIKQIKEMKPEVICSLGNYATKFFLSKYDPKNYDEKRGITLLHGKVKMLNIDNLKIKLIPLFHPAAMIYNQKLKEEWEKDMDVVKKEVLFN